MTKQALKFLDGLDAKQYRQVGSTIFGLMTNPAPHDAKPLHGATGGEQRVDVGEYRIVFAATTATLEILIIGKRNDDDVYKRWERSR